MGGPVYTPLRIDTIDYFSNCKLQLTKIITLAISAVYGDYENRPRGVSAEKASFYAEGDKFSCLDGSKTIPFERVNDDYCDCADGSDEPGTSACGNGKFHCRNFGFRPVDIPSSRVNDQLCDCCDGSDEWDSGVTCPNVCDELGAKAREHAAGIKALAEKGFAKRRLLSEEGSKSMEEKKTELEKAKRELEDLQPLKASYEEKKNTAEELERNAKEAEDRLWDDEVEKKRNEESAELFKRLDKNSDGRVTFDEFKVALELPEDSTNSYPHIFGDDKELNEEQFRSKILDIRSLFHTKAEASSTTTSAPVAEADDTQDNESDLDGDDNDLEPEPEESLNEAKPDYTEDTQNLIKEADRHRQQYRETSDKLFELENKIRDTENFLNSEYGPDYAWAPLKGQCPEIAQAQYIYKLCLFDRAIQKEKNGHSEIGLGNWREWEGPEGNKYSKQKYADGQHCWNGPARSTVVHVECGEELELYDVKEPAKCEYEFKLRSPAACPDPSTLTDSYAVHTEL